MIIVYNYSLLKCIDTAVTSDKPSRITIHEIVDKHFSLARSFRANRPTSVFVVTLRDSMKIESLDVYTDHVCMRIGSFLR